MEEEPERAASPAADVPVPDTSGGQIANSPAPENEARVNGSLEENKGEGDMEEPTTLQQRQYTDEINVEPVAADESQEEIKEGSEPKSGRGVDNRTIWMQEKLTESFTKFEAASQWKEHHEDYSRSFLNSDQQKNMRTQNSRFHISCPECSMVSIETVFLQFCVLKRCDCSPCCRNHKGVHLEESCSYQPDQKAGRRNTPHKIIILMLTLGQKIDAQDYQVFYFIKKAMEVEILEDNLDLALIAGMVDGDPLDDLLSRMNSKYLNTFLSETSWPDGVKKEFVDRLHKFMATITEASHLAKNTTTLYIPHEDLTDPAAAIKDRDLIHRLESTVIHWTRQIKEIVINQDSQQDRENLSPLDEIKHWRTRTFNLSFIHSQLEKPELKRIIEVLEMNDSSNLKNFKNLAEMIKKGSEQANDNLRFLSKLQDPCQKLEASEPKNIPKILPDILNCVRMIFELSTFYNTPDRIRGLLTKISNQIIKRCREKININEIHDGDVEKVMNDLDESIQCGLEWREVFEKSEVLIGKYSSLKERWDIGDKKSVFAQVEAFVQRCKDLKNICLGQLQFARKATGMPLPQFGGAKGPEIAANLNELERSFKKHLDKIRKVDYDILDVLKMSKWHEDFADFNNNVKDLEVMFMNIISLAFNSVSTVEDAVQMLDNFDLLAKRQAIKDYVQTKAADKVFQMFMQEATLIETMNSEQKKKPPYPISHPKFAGNALYTRSLLCRLENAKEAIDQLWFIEDEKLKQEANEKFMKVHASLDQFITVHLFGAWKDEISGMDPENVQSRLEQPVLMRSGASTGALNIDPEEGMINPLLTKSNEGALESNFDKGLLRLIVEVQYWSKLQSSGIVIPHQVHQILQNKEKLRVLRENVMLVVRDYNSILDSLGKMERPIFQQNMEELDSEIEPGTKRYRWNSSNVAENFVRKCRVDCAQMAKNIARFKKNHSEIMGQFRLIEETDLIEIAKKKIYILKDFLEEQAHHRKRKKKEFQVAFNIVKIKIMNSYDLFLECKTEVQLQWLRYIQLLDAELYDALLKSVQNSFLILSRAIRGDQKTDPITLFKVYTMIDSSKNVWGVMHDPSHSELLDGINEVMTKINFVTEHIPRLEKVFREEREVVISKLIQERKRQEEEDTTKFGMAKGRRGQGFVDYNQQGMDDEDWQEHYKLPTHYKEGRQFHQKIAQDKDLIKRRELIEQGVNNVEERLKEDVAKWKSHETRQLYNMSTKKGKQRTFLQKIDPMNTDIMGRYQATLDLVMEQMSTVHREPTPTNEQFIQIDSSKLKQKLIDMGQQFLIDLMQQLHEEVMEDIKNMYQEFARTVKQLNTTPSGLQELKENMQLHDKMKENIPVFQASIKPIKAKFEFLQQQEESNINEEEERQLKELPGAFEQFKTDLGEVYNNVILRWYRTFRQEVETELEDFKRSITELKKNFQQQAPIHALEGLTNEKARAILEEFTDICKSHRDHEEEMKLGLDIFMMGHPTYMDLASVEKELQLLGRIWSLKEEWDAQWDAWKVQSFRVVEQGEMDIVAKEFQDRMKTLPREIKQWDIHDSLKGTIEKFRRTMPLIEDLRHDAMRKRHWEELQREVGGVFDPFSDSFTLEELFKLKLNNHAEFIFMLTDRAQNEYDLEVKLKKIESNWAAIELKVVQRENKNGDIYHIVEPTDEVTQTLDDDVKRLSTIKTSPYYAQFEGEIEEWEITLANISDTLDLLMTVQRNWSHLESIFNLQDDMSFQLPNEASIFAGVNKSFLEEMDRIYKDNNARRALTHEGFNDTLLDFNRRLEHIQRSLEQFLKSKRILFPRFYFISNDDLLEMLGQSKDISAVQKHVKKCFEGIDSLEAVKRNKQFEIIKVRSVEREEITLIKPLPVEQGVEVWLRKLQERVQESLKVLLKNALVSRTSRNEKKDKMMREHSGQLLVTAGQLVWTQEVQKTLTDIDNGNQNTYKTLKGQWKRHVTSLISLVRNLSGVERMKLIALITIEVHNRDIIDKLALNNISSPKQFMWMQQLRFDKREENDQVIVTVKQTNTEFPYGYEYQGNNGRLVVTPLTDRCYMTLTNAMLLHRGGAPQGPAGTGKTETVKDLGKNMARFVVVFNCSESLNYKSLGHTFSGLAQSGAWGCFDEFNRIEREVLSVVAQQISTILEALREERSSFNFEGDLIGLNMMVGIFITMNPGYAGRTELPDNLKSLFRPVAMMVPDFVKIAEIMLMSEGFQTYEDLSKKVVSIYALMKKQLSKQHHYDFELRAIKSVLLCSGRIKKEKSGQMDEQQIVMKAVRDMNLPKFVSEDVPLFNALFNDLFKGSELPETDNVDLLQAIDDQMTEMKLQLNEQMLNKVLQLLDSLSLRHGNMLVGNTLSGKSTCWKILQGALNRLHFQELEKLKPAPGFNLAEMQNKQIRIQILNPKSITINQLFGYYDMGGEWHDGILSRELKRFTQDPSPDQKWLLLDGPVDTLWIESMNSVLDDSKILTLNNGDRIALNETIRVIFEVQNLAVASPATVSRAAMIYLDIEEVGWNPFVEQWINNKPGIDDEYRQFLEELFQKYVTKVLTVKQFKCKELEKTSEFNLIRSLCRLFDALATPENGVVKLDEGTVAAQGGANQRTGPPGGAAGEEFFALVEKWFAFCVVWSIGASVDQESRREIDYIMRDIESIFPHSNTVYEYFVSPEKNDWVAWEERIQGTFRPEAETPFHKILIPTIDTVRNRYIVQALIKSRQQVCLLGHTGVGKTALVQGMLNTLNVDYFTLQLNFSAGSSAKKTQEIIEGKFEKRTKDKLYPPHSKKAICFVDDLNMPRVDKFGSQPPLELLRQWYDYGGWYDLQKLIFKNIMDLQLITSMGPPDGGRAHISQRLLSKFHLVTVTIPQEMQIERIFSTLATLKFSDFDDEIKMISSQLAKATLSLFQIVQEKFLPRPAKSHYLFNMRDMSKVFQGLYRADKNFYESKASMVKLWSHEVMRVFYDRLNDYQDRQEFQSHLAQQVQIHFELSYADDIQDVRKEDPIFVDFLNENMEVYEEVQDYDALCNYLNIKLNDYNNEPRAIRMDLVLFKDAITNCCNIYRLLKLERGNVLLVGVGGSGRHSLTKLAAYMAEMKTLKVEVTRSFDIKNFREFLKSLYTTTGTNNKTGVFLFSDNDIIQEAFLEDVSNILSSGEVPNLFDGEELQAIREAIRKDFKLQMPGSVETPDAIYEFFLNRVRANLHIGICMSPIGEQFRNYCRMYPALINNATINWFMKWPEDALREVAKRFVERCTQIPQPQKSPISAIITYTHSTVEIAARQMRKELKRVYYVTPTNYIELMRGYEKILGDKAQEIGNQIEKLRTGLSKLEDARKQVEEMTAESELRKADMSKKQKMCSDLIAKIEKEDKLADEKQKFIGLETEKIDKERKECEHVAWEAEQELKKAEPALLAAQEALESLDKKFIAEVKTYSQPPQEVAMVMYAVMIILGQEASWPSAKRALSATDFIQRIKGYDKDKITNKQLRQIEKYTKEDNFKPEIITNVSTAAGKLCMWVRSIEDYAKALREVQPKREKRDYALENLKKKEESLRNLTEQLSSLMAQIAQLKDQHQKANDEMRKNKEEIEELQIRIDRGEKLVTGLAGEKTRWQASLQEYDDNFEKLTGDCLISASFMSYAGPFPSQYREELLSLWMAQVRANKVPHTQKFDITEFLVNGAIVRDWNTQGLPTDNFSIENGVMVTKGLRWPLMIDPQNQAQMWIQKMEDPENRKKLLVADQKSRDFLRILENGIYQGKPVLMPDLGEEIDPAIDSVLNKNTRKTMKGLVIKIGDKEIQYNQKFRLYLFTRMPNPHYTPEISTKICLINFTVKESGLEEQLLGIVVKHEEPTLEKNKAEFVLKIARSKKQLIELEDQILRKLQESKVSLLEDEDLVLTLQTSKNTSDEVKQALETAEQTMKKIDIARESYRPCGNKASILFFVLYDLNKIDPMYQFSLDWYIDLFVSSIQASKESPSMDPTDARIKSILKFHTHAVFRNACRSLFERHKLLLSLQMCAKLRISEGQIDINEWNFFLYGGDGFSLPADKDPMPNPEPRWISNTSWENILKLEYALKETFQGIPGAISHNPKEWNRWYMSAQPENEPLPGEWETKCEDKLRKMIILRCMRRDRVIFAARSFVENKMGPKFVDNKPFTIAQVYSDSKATTPIIFVLSPGVDPLDSLVTYARQLEKRIETVSLGQGQSERACALLYDGAHQGFWVYLANCHLSVTWLPELESIIDSVMKKNPNPNFRLFLSSNPHPKFPISILQRSSKMTTEPPKGIGSNMIRLYQSLEEYHFVSVMDKHRYRRIIFGLCWYHSILVERKKFKELGWNVRYDFNDSDFSVCEDLIAYYLGRTYKDKPVEIVKQMPWQAIQYLIADANYGGRVTDDIDRRLLKVYAAEIFNEGLLVDRWKPPVPEELGYIYPDESSVKQPSQVSSDYNLYGVNFFIEHIMKFPASDLPEAFGQHVNAEISSQIQDTHNLLSAIISLQPRQTASSEGISQEEFVMNKIEELKELIPQEVDITDVKEKDPYDTSPLKVVLLQELQRYNSLLQVVSRSLVNLARGIKGLALISPELEEVMDSLFYNQVPKQWLFAYQSLKTLSEWVKDLNDRYTFFVDWAYKQLPSVFWISAFTYPTGFTTGLLQKTSRRTGESIDNLHIDYIFTNNMDGKISEHAKEGAYVRGLFLEGARWNSDKNCLMENEVMSLECKLPVIQFKPVAKPKKTYGGDLKKYPCPCYYYPVRAGFIDRASFMFTIDMKTGDHPVEFWIKRGTAVLMSLSE